MSKEIIVLTLDSSDDNKGVSSKGPSITSIPKERPSIAKAVYGAHSKDCLNGMNPEKYSDVEDADRTNHVEDADGTNHSDLKLVKRGKTRLYKFRREYGKPGGIKIKRYFDVDLTVRNLEKSARGKMARSKNVYHHKMGRGGYVFVKEKMMIGLDQWEITFVFGKEKGGYTRGVGSRVKYKRYFHLPRSRRATDERIELLQTQLDNERRERQQKDELVKKLSTEMTQKDVELSSQLKVASDVTPMGAYEVDRTQSSVVVCDKDARIKTKSKWAC
ncbi:hypothetical protein Tco_0925082 [Tanacetum coccineum]|uniref:Uncharacterized protein n=1 Tax=Tanacetum coccineum TaxID=301880 RepID=A0ABQ5D8M8_9ASTR